MSKDTKCISFVNPKGGTEKTTILNFDFGKQWGGDVVMKVLVVEDNPLNMELVLEVLDSNGFTAHGAVDGEKAISMAEKETYDLIIMDIELPDMDGVETARMIQGDRVQLCQLFFHLIDNAIKFRSTSQPHAHISAREQGGDWVFSVKDNGVGIDPKFHDSLFLVSEHIRETESKTGIGLAICKKIVERQGGRIQVESEKGKGSTFRFTIPKGGGQWGGKTDI